MRVVSGIQPTGDLHLGHYFGAIGQYLALQDDHDCFLFVVDYHALTTIRDADILQRYRHECVCAYLALGLDPQRAAVFVQSDVPEVTELAWILSTVTPLGVLQRAHAYKDRVTRGLPADLGLLAYPVLMAADILLYGGEIVPVGPDQKQHVEMARDIAQRFNGCYGLTFGLPEAHTVPTVPGLDGRKMAKRHNNTIGVFEAPDVIRAKVMNIQTDSRPAGEPRDPYHCTLFSLFRLFAEEDESVEVEAQYRRGAARFERLKRRLVDLIGRHFALARQRRVELVRQPERVQQALESGRARARRVASETMLRVRETVGLQILRQE